MSSPLHHTTSAAFPDAWTTEILPLLPSDLEVQARVLGAFQRQRAFDSAASLLRALLHHALSQSSLRALGAWAVITQLADLAPSSWLEHLRTAAPWLHYIAQSLLNLPKPRFLSQRVRGRVLLVDATSLRQSGGSGDDWRIHLAYNLLAGRFEQLLLSDKRTAEHIAHFLLLPGDLVVLDTGYGYRDRLARIHQALADGVLRIYPPTFPLETATGKPVDVRAWLDQPGANQRSQVAFFRHEQQRFQVRVLALRRNELSRQQAQRQAKERARKKQRELSEVVQYYADWILIVTTLNESEWPDQAVWRVYAARWQIEIVFKRVKQFLGLGELRTRTAASTMGMIWALLVVWLLQEGQAQAVREKLQELAEVEPSTLPGQKPEMEAVVSGWGVSQMMLNGIRQAIAGTWTIGQVRASLPQLRRYLVTHPRKDREHQATEVVAWLSGVYRTRRRPLPSAV